MTDVPMFDIPRPCARCGRPDTVTDPAMDVCGYCLHLDHRTPPVSGSCPWCAASSVGRDAATMGGKSAADADPDFTEAVFTALTHVRRQGRPFTAADVRAVLAEWEYPITRPAAIGSVFGTVHALGLIKPTGNFIPSPVKGQHGRPLREWVAA